MASQPRERASGSHAYERHEMQGVILKCTRHECSVFVNLRPHLLHKNSYEQLYKFCCPQLTAKWVIYITVKKSGALLNPSCAGN